MIQLGRVGAATFIEWKEPLLRPILVGAAVVAALAVAWWFSRPPSVPTPVVEVTHGEAPSSQLMTVHVTGAVERPGLVSLPPGARVAEAVAAAGGVTGAAQLSGFNLAAPVGDGQLIVVPDAGDGTTAESVATGTISLNQASAAQLEALPGVGPVLAGRIVEHRDVFGPFQKVEDLLDVSGVGEAKLAAMRELVTVP